MLTLNKQSTKTINSMSFVLNMIKRKFPLIWRLRVISVSEEKHLISEILDIKGKVKHILHRGVSLFSLTLFLIKPSVWCREQVWDSTMSWNSLIHSLSVLTLGRPRTSGQSKPFAKGCIWSHVADRNSRGVRRREPGAQRPRSRCTAPTPAPSVERQEVKGCRSSW